MVVTTISLSRYEWTTIRWLLEVWQPLVDSISMDRGISLASRKWKTERNIFHQRRPSYHQWHFFDYTLLLIDIPRSTNNSPRCDARCVQQWFDSHGDAWYTTQMVDINFLHRTCYWSCVPMEPTNWLIDHALVNSRGKRGLTHRLSKRGHILKLPLWLLRSSVVISKSSVKHLRVIIDD